MTNNTEIRLTIYSSLLIEIGNINRFKSAEKLCSYAGLVLRVIQSILSKDM
ncbi:MAG TPA: hypothetical protein ENF39_01085 [Candidatus Aenigmarchaeota archaeon]|nr:hypothetical protein [Candidatus Aenigmarchaeota archaeon]